MTGSSRLSRLLGALIGLSEEDLTLLVHDNEEERHRQSDFGLCFYSDRCRYYDLDGVVCNEEGGGPYCGEYRRLSAERRGMILE